MKEHKKRYYGTGIIAVLLTTVFCTFQAYAAPVITVTKGNPADKQAPPCTIEFSVSDPAGVVSIVVNGRELGPNGGDFYEGDYITYYNSTVNISAVNRNGESSSKSVQITNLTTALEQPQVERPTAPPQTQAPQSPQTQPQTQAPQPPQTQPQTTQARVPETTRPRVQETTQAPTTKTEETEPVETSPVEETIEETEERQMEETETAAEESSPNEETEPETKGTEAETIEETTAPELPPDSYKLYPGGRKNKMIPQILICACICAIGYLITAILLNRKRLKKYKQLHEVLIKRQDMITQKDYERIHENTIDGLPEDEEEENESK